MNPGLYSVARETFRMLTVAREVLWAKEKALMESLDTPNG